MLAPTDAFRFHKTIDGLYPSGGQSVIGRTVGNAKQNGPPRVSTDRSASSVGLETGKLFFVVGLFVRGFVSFVLFLVGENCTVIGTEDLREQVAVDCRDLCRLR